MPGRFGRGYFFKPSTYFTIPSPEGFHVEQFTMAAWASIIAIDENEALIGTGEDGPESHALLFMVRYANGTADPGLGASVVNASGTAASLPHIPVPHFLQWHHYAMTYDGHEVRLYVDGVLGSRGPLTGQIIVPPGTPLFINRHDFRGNSTSRLRGTIDDVAIFTRALSPTEIEALAHDANGNGIADFWEH